MTTFFPPQAVAIAAGRLRAGGWTTILHGDARDESFWIYRSERDPRVTCCRTIHRSGSATVSFCFDMLAGHVLFPALPAANSKDDLASFPGLDQVAEHILIHDAALAQEGPAP